MDASFAVAARRLQAEWSPWLLQRVRLARD